MSNHDITGPEPIDCVIIGINASATLADCLKSIQVSEYPNDLLHLYYIDGGSTDDSLAIARSFDDVHVIQITPEFPTPGLGRNTGWRAGSSPFVQFLDSDTEVAPDWFAQGIAAITGGVAAVQGYRTEKHPQQSRYNWIGDLEWNGPPGEADSFGGDVLIRRQVLEQTGGYDEELVGGEDPELSQRIRLAGWKIIQLDTVMTSHDLGMTRFDQYWKRAFRSGYGFAAVIDRFSNTSHDFWHVEFRRILVRGGGFVVLSLLGLLCFAMSPFSPSFFIPGLTAIGIGAVLLFFPRIFRISALMYEKKINRHQAKIYANHCSFVVIPDIFGVARYFIGKWLNRPLRNKRSALSTSGGLTHWYQSTPNDLQA